jgi:hypothetical protein
VKSIVRTLLVCFLLLALPFQAFASASMLPRAGVGQPAASIHAPLHETAAAELPPCHQQMGMQAAPVDGKTQDHQPGQHAKAKCGAGAACCVAAAPAPCLPAALAPPPPGTASIPFRAGHLPSVDPVLPERPPSTLFA